MADPGDLHQQVRHRREVLPHGRSELQPQVRQLVTGGHQGIENLQNLGGSIALFYTVSIAEPVCWHHHQSKADPESLHRQQGVRAEGVLRCPSRDSGPLLRRRLCRRDVSCYGQQ